MPTVAGYYVPQEIFDKKERQYHSYLDKCAWQDTRKDAQWLCSRKAHYGGYCYQHAKKLTGFYEPTRTH